MMAPSTWTAVPLSDLLTFKNGLNKGSEFFGSGTPIVNFMDVMRHTEIRRKDVTGSVRVSSDEIKRFAARKNDLFFTRTSETVEEVGTCALLTEGVPGAVFSGFVLRARLKRGDVVPAFLVRALRAQPVREQVIRTATYTTRALTNGGVLGRVTVALPSVEEQVEIAEALRDVDKLVESLSTLVAKKRAIRAGMVQGLLASRSHGDEVLRLGDLGGTVRGVGYDPGSDLRQRRQADTVDLLRANNIQRSRLDLKDLQFVHRRRVRHDQYLRCGDVLICAANGSKRLVGKAALIEETPALPMTFGAFMMVYRPRASAVLPAYAFLHFETKAYRDWIELLLTGSSINNLRPSDLAAFEIAIPERAEQERLAAIFRDVDTEIAVIEQRLKSIVAIRRGMTQELFTGRVSLSPERVTG